MLIVFIYPYYTQQKNPVGYSNTTSIIYHYNIFETNYGKQTIGSIIHVLEFRPKYHYLYNDTTIY